MGEPGASATCVLLVDDDETIHQIVSKFLGEAGFKVIGTQDPDRAMPMLLRHRPSAALLDMNMPGTNGLVLLDRIRKASGIPVIMVTAEESVETAVRALKLGAYDYLTKPIDFRKLVGTIRQALATTPGSKGGQFISHYELIGELGRGGMGVVYLARDTLLDRRVALKALLPDVFGDPMYEARLLNEARSLARLDHPGIVKVHEINRESGWFYIVMELVEGTSLQALLDQGHRFTTREAAILGLQIARALAIAHAKGVVHRDLKPANVILNESRFPKIVDFGLACSSGNSSPLFAGFSGTLGFAAPEQISNLPPTPRSDIYSLGALLCRLLRSEEHQSLSHGAPLQRFQEKLVSDPFEQVRPRADLPEALLQLLRRMTLRDPEKRPGSMDEVAAAIDAVVTR